MQLEPSNWRASALFFPCLVGKRQIFSSASGIGDESGITDLHMNIVRMSNARCPWNACQMYDKIPKRNPASLLSSRDRTPNLVEPFEYFAQYDMIHAWTSKMSNLIKGNRPRKAIYLFKEMLINAQKPNFVTILSVIKAAVMVGSRYVVLGVHGYSIKVGFLESQALVATALSGAYSKWDMSSTWKLYAEAPKKDVVFSTAMITSCLGKVDYAGAFNLFSSMLFSGLQPNYVTLATVLAACADVAALETGKQIHCYSIRKSLSHHMIFLNSLMDMYSKCKCLDSALHVFDHMQDRDIVSCRIIICGSVKNGSPIKALEIFHRMRASNVKVVDEYILQELIRACSPLDEKFMLLEFHSLIWKVGLINFVPLVTELLQAYGKFEDIGSSRSIFDHLNFKDIVAWSVMISTYSQNNKAKDAFDMFREMQLTDCRPNQYTFLSLLHSCTKIDAVDIGKSIHAQIIKYGYPDNTNYLTSALIDMYCNFGQTKEGEAVFDEDLHKDLICWSSIINGYAINGCGEEALECFSAMLSSGIEPNDVVFVSVLSACSHCGLDYEAWNWFDVMESVYGIKPNLAHYTCMVDMLIRQGNLEEAVEFVNRMPIEPDKRIWGALLSGCRNAHAPPEFLNLVSQKLMNLDPNNTSYYVSISNLFADQGRWEQVEELRNMINSKPTKKLIGYSML